MNDKLLQREKITTYQKQPRFTLFKEDGIYIITGKEIERHVAMTDLDNDEAVNRLQKIMQLMGIEDALREAGVREGDIVKIRDFEFEYVQ